jgi:3-oxoacyl-[acyl-carrier protein] reductase
VSGEGARVALVTGGSGQLGGEICRVLDAAGYDVAVHYMSGAERAEAVASELGRRTTVVQADLADWDAVAEMEEKVRAELGPVAVLVNSGAVRNDGLMAGQSPEKWRQVIDVNLIGTFHACRAVVARMLRARWGRIVNVVSPAGLIGSPGQTAYSASKAGVIGMTRSLAYECGRRGVTVNCLSPGFMETEITAGVPAEVKEAILARTPLARFGNPAEVAALIPMIVDAAYMTGQVISVDGGLSI